jgi:hypothetical protein
MGDEGGESTPVGRRDVAPDMFIGDAVRDLAAEPGLEVDSLIEADAVLAVRERCD